MTAQQNNESTMYNNQEKIIPMKWTGWDEMDMLANMYYNCMFTTDFGPFIANKHYETIFIDYANGVIESYINEGSDVEHSANFTASIIELLKRT